MPPDRNDERYQPLALVSVTLIALLGFAVFFLSFLVAPLAILMIFYVGFAASNRSRKSNGNGNGDAPAQPVSDEDEPHHIGYHSGASALLTRDARARQDAAADDVPRAEAARTSSPGG